MKIHQEDKNMLPDSHFIPGELALIVPGNKGRLLDGRRTPGIIEEFDLSSAMFRWRITDFEDKGRIWIMPAEKITSFQLEKGSIKLTEEELQQIKKRVLELDIPLCIDNRKTKFRETAGEIKQSQDFAEAWLKKSSRFLAAGKKLDFARPVLINELAEDLLEYMLELELLNLEKRTAHDLVLNPFSGEWIKGMEIVLAEMGILPFQGKIPRTRDIFTGEGCKKLRKKYIIKRLAFLQAYFKLQGISEVVLYRGMSTEGHWQELERTFLSCTFSLDVARGFSVFERESRFKNSYLVKLTVPVEDIFMTCLETKEMCHQYQEAEALVLYTKKFIL